MRADLLEYECAVHGDRVSRVVVAIVDTEQGITEIIKA